MIVFWDSLIRPLLHVLQPRLVLEIGAYKGEATANLIAYCQANGATLHTIEPMPLFDADVWEAASDGAFVFHRGKSLEVLPSLPPPDLALLDGDHNWYTVYHELKALAALASDAGRPFPLVLFHDIGWPYARRDLYYDPTDIPDEFRQPYARQGILLGRNALHKYGINEELCNAVREGGPRNGVLTAVEDFMAESAEPLRLLSVHGLHGLGVLYPAAVREQPSALANHLLYLEAAVAMLGGHLLVMEAALMDLIVDRHRRSLRREAYFSEAALEVPEQNAPV